MLTRLTIKNYALIQDIELELKQGLTSMTGETGAGKSIILGAISLLTGNRADLSVIRAKDKKCIIEAEFDLSNLNLAGIFEKYDLDYDKDTLVRREFSKDGKSRVFINDSPAVLLHLKDLMRRMLDVHSQHENLELNNKNYQLKAIDLYANNKLLLEDYKKSFASYNEASEKLESLRTSSERLRENAAYLTHQLNELNDADLKEGEQEELEQEQKVLVNSEEIKESLQLVERSLNDETQNPIDVLSSLETILKKASNLVPDIKELSERLESAIIELEDIRREVGNYSSGLNFNPERASEVQDRLSELYRLEQKHKVNSAEALIQKRDELDEEVGDIQNLDDRIAEAEKEYEKAKEQCDSFSDKLSLSRNEVKKKFGNEVGEVLVQLGMPDCQFQVVLNPLESSGPNGKDDIDFLFSANKGISTNPISKVASGGEIARLMLAIKSILATKSELPTVIFDEIDTGISGEIAEKMGRVIQQMSKKTQVLIITHLPQIAALGNDHISVYKDSSGEESKTMIRKLNSDSRIKEIARLLSGEEITNEAINNAKVLLGKKG